MSKKCYVKPQRRKPRIYTERDVGRIVAYARNDGANDVVLIAYIMQSFGVKDLACLAFKILDILNTGFFLGAIIGLLNGILVFLKGFKLLRTLKRATIPGFLEMIVPSKYLGSLGTFYIYTGAISAICSGAIVFLTAISNNVALYLLMGGICEQEVAPLSVDVKELQIGDLEGRLDELIEVFDKIDQQ